MTVAEIHEERETLTVSVFLPGHEPRGDASALFTRTRRQLIQRDHVCFICGCVEAEVGPLEAHHFPIERSLANLIDWKAFSTACKSGEYGHAAQVFDWDKFFGGKDAPDDPYIFVDDMTVNGLLLCKAHHTGKDEGIHCMPHPLWLAQKFAVEGYKYSEFEIIHHHQE